MSKKLWAGRFKKMLDLAVESYTASISFDDTLFHEDILGSLAHTKMLEKCGLINTKDSDQLQMGLKKIWQKYALGKIKFKIEDEDIHTGIERYLREDCGEVAEKLHTARSRNDQVALDTHLYLRKKIILAISLLIELQNTLLNISKQHQDTIFPGYTHLQQAQPIYLAQHWLAYFAMFQRDIERLQNNWVRVNQSPLGACALAGSTLSIDKYFVAEELGCDGVYINTLDAVSDRDFIIEFLAAASIIMMHISRLSEELILWSSQEFNFITLDDAYCTGSSIMPQKKNPDIAELGRGKTARVYGALITLLTLLKGLPLAYNKDLQEDKEPLFDVVKTLTQTLSIYVPLLATLKINLGVIHQTINNSYLNATALAEYLVKKNISFRTAHEVAGKIVSYCIDKSCQLGDLTLAEMRKFSSMITEDVFQSLSIENIALECNTNHSSKSSLLANEIQTCEKQIITSKAWLLQKRDGLENIYVKFDLSLKEIL
ncbi:MAG TPA: argininosuccinate lyase [Gammaproteobacteria bacterium]|nr:argininosuccinate lyase [Gammaproteobacteria bacterium]